MSDFIRIEAMDEAIAAYKQDKREDVEKEILARLHEIVDIYKAYNPDGQYLSLCFNEGTYMVENAYFAEDNATPVKAYEIEGEYSSGYVRDPNFYLDGDEE